MKFVKVLLLTVMLLFAGNSPVLRANPVPADVSQDHWTYDAIAALAEDGFDLGFDNGKFNGDKPVTRYVLASFVGQALEKAGVQTKAKQPPFADVSADNQYAKYVTLVTNNTSRTSFITNDDDKNFRGDSYADRYCITAALAKLAKLKDPNQTVTDPPALPDLPKDHWAYNDVAFMMSKNIVDGYGDGTFRGEGNMTRYEFVLLLARMYAYEMIPR